MPKAVSETNVTNDPAQLDLEEVKRGLRQVVELLLRECFHDKKIPREECCTWSVAALDVGHAIRLVEEVEYLRNRLTNYYQDNCENAYVDATLYKEALEQIAKLTEAVEETQGGTMSNGVGNPSKDPLGDIQREIDAAAGRSGVASGIMATVIAEGLDPREDQALIVACESVEAHMKEALRLIRLYRP